jgi:glycine cleavage system aminomethyltransferase T
MKKETQKCDERNARAEALVELRGYIQEDDLDYLAIQWSKESGICFYCKNKLRTSIVGEDGWEVYCQTCDMLYSED